MACGGLMHRSCHGNWAMLETVTLFLHVYPPAATNRPETLADILQRVLTLQPGARILTLPQPVEDNCTYLHRITED